MAEYDEQSLLLERDQAESWLRQQQGVVGTGLGLDSGGRPCIKVFTNHLPTTTRDAIKTRMKDVPIDFEETGEFKKF